MDIIAFWSILIQGTVLGLRQVKLRVIGIISVVIVAVVVLLTASGLIFSNSSFDAGNASIPCDPIPNEPIGTPQGVYPGRVVWIWDENATEKTLTCSTRVFHSPMHLFCFIPNFRLTTEETEIRKEEKRKTNFFPGS